MKTKEKKELQLKKAEELRKLLKEAQTNLLNAKLDNKQNKLKNTRSIFTFRKQIAIIKTVMNMQKEQTEKTDKREVTK
jgi:ribosomal protein L29